MRNLEQWKIRTTDNHGVLDGAGFTFFEPRYRLIIAKGLAGGLGIFMLVAVGFGLYFSRSTEARVTWGILGLGALGALVWGFRMKHESIHTQRVVIFTRTGEILVSKRGADRNDPILDVVPATIDDIRAIDTRPQMTWDGHPEMVSFIPGIWMPSYEVNIHFQDEQRLQVAAKIYNADEARIVSTQLNMALAEIRAARGYY